MLFFKNESLPLDSEGLYWVCLEIKYEMADDGQIGLSKVPSNEMADEMVLILGSKSILKCQAKWWTKLS